MSDIAAAKPAFTDKPIRAAIIDLDGTMVDTAATSSSRSTPCSRASARRRSRATKSIGYVGKGSENLIRSVLAVRLLAVAGRRAVRRRARDLPERIPKPSTATTATLYPGSVKEGLEAMREMRHLRLACVTNKPHRVRAPLLAHFGLRRLFRGRLRRRFARRKRSPIRCRCCRYASDFDAAAARKWWRSATRQTMRSAARAAGMRVLTVPYGYNHGKACTRQSNPMV